MFEKLKAKRRLKRIERATDIRLMPRQRKIALDKNRPEFGCEWGRASGKTTAAIFWTLMWRDLPIGIENEQNKISARPRPLFDPDPLPAIPDPDVNTYQCLMYVLHRYVEYTVNCSKHGIKVAFVCRRNPF